MIEMLTTCEIFLIFSITVNLSVGIFFFCTPLLKHCFEKSNRQICQRFVKLFEEKPGIVRKFFRDEIFTITLFIYGIVLLAATNVLEKPFTETPSPVLAAFAINLGHYVYKCLQDCQLRSQIPLFKINLLHHVVTIATYTVFIYYKQNAISGVVGLLFEGSVIFFDLCSLFRVLGVRKNAYIYVICVLVGFTFTVVFRVICPIVLMITMLLKSNPLGMDYLPLGFFFMNIVFYSMVNGWLVKSSLESLRRRVLSRQIINELSRVRNLGMLELDLEQSLGGLELNNATHRQSARQPVTVVIPEDERFRLMPHVSNLNMDFNRGVVSNITTSRHERTLPRFNAIVNDTSSTTSDGATSLLSSSTPTFV